MTDPTLVCAGPLLQESPAPMTQSNPCSRKVFTFLLLLSSFGFAVLQGQVSYIDGRGGQHVVGQESSVSMTGRYMQLPQAWRYMYSGGARMPLEKVWTEPMHLQQAISCPGRAWLGRRIGITATTGEAEPGRTAKNGDEVLVLYNASFEDGRSCDGSGAAPILVKLGDGNVPFGVENAIQGLQVGQRVSVTVPPEEGYGYPERDAFVTVDEAQLPKGAKKGMSVQVSLPSEGGGEEIWGIIVAYTPEGVVLDTNSPLAGETLQYEIELVGFSE